MALSITIQSGTWARAGYKSYMDILGDYATNIPRCTVDSIGTDSEGPDTDHPINEREECEGERKESLSPSSTLVASNGHMDLFGPAHVSDGYYLFFGG